MSQHCRRWLSFVSALSALPFFGAGASAEPVNCKGEVARNSVNLVCYDNAGRVAAKIIGNGKHARARVGGGPAIASRIIGNGDRADVAGEANLQGALVNK